MTEGYYDLNYKMIRKYAVVPGKYTGCSNIQGAPITVGIKTWLNKQRVHQNEDWKQGRRKTEFPWHQL